VLHRVCPSLSPTRKGGERGTPPPKNQSHPSRRPQTNKPPFFSTLKRKQGEASADDQPRPGAPWELSVGLLST